jgi:hypothetical protein
VGGRLSIPQRDEVARAKRTLHGECFGICRATDYPILLGDKVKENGLDET